MNPSTIPARETVDLSAGTLRYVDMGEGEPLVFVHPFLTDHNAWRKVLPDLAQHFRCLAPAWPLGSHTIPMKESADLTPRALGDLVIEFLDALGLERVTLIGNDTGGAICQLAATAHPERVRRLVLLPCDAFDNFPPRMFRFLKLIGSSKALTYVMSNSLRPSFARRLPFTYGWVTKYPVDSDVLRSFVRPAIEIPEVRRDIRKEIAGLSPQLTIDAAEKLRTFPAPVLLAWSREDRFFPPEHAERLAEIIPNATLRWVDDSATFIAEDQPEALTKLLIDFLDA